MLDKDLQSTLSTIQDATNPEIFHFRYGTHPGSKYNIKTIIPGPRIINDDTYVFWQFWETLANKYPRLIRLIDHAYDWHGNVIEHWWTIWLEQRVDISWTWSRQDGIDFHLVDFDISLKSSAKKSIDFFNEHYDRLSAEDQLCFDQLEEIANFLQSYTSNRLALLNRQNLKLIQND